MHSGQVPLLSIIFLNLDNPVIPYFQEVDIRLALLMGIDRERIINPAERWPGNFRSWTNLPWQLGLLRWG